MLHNLSSSILHLQYVYIYIYLKLTYLPTKMKHVRYMVQYMKNRETPTHWLNLLTDTCVSKTAVYKSVVRPLFLLVSLNFFSFLFSSLQQFLLHFTIEEIISFAKRKITRIDLFAKTTHTHILLIKHYSY